MAVRRESMVWDMSYEIRRVLFNKENRAKYTKKINFFKLGRVKTV